MTGLGAFAAVLAGHCPRCGLAPMFKRVLELRNRCRSCGLDYRFIDTGDGPAVFATFILGAAALGLALWVEFSFGPPLWVHAVLWGLVLPFVALGVLRLLKSLLITLQYRHGAGEGRVTRSD